MTPTPPETELTSLPATIQLPHRPGASWVCRVHFEPDNVDITWQLYYDGQVSPAEVLPQTLNARQALYLRKMLTKWVQLRRAP